jgi:hypothetical protein
METMMGTPMKMTSTMFNGPEVKGGSVMATRMNDGIMLSLSDDFVIPGAPAPHWQVVDAAGNAYLLQRLQVANDRVHRTITVPAYVRQVAKVRVYCAFAEVVLGEVSFASPVM